MADWFIATAVCLGFVWSGWQWAKAIPPVEPPLMATLALSYLVGTALVTLAMLGVALVGLPVNRLTLILSFVVVRRTCLVRASRESMTPVRGPFTRWTVAGLAMTTFALGFGLMQAIRLGSIGSTDFLKAWGLKGLAVATDHNLDFAHISSPNLFYPLEVSNLHGAVMLSAGNRDDAVLRLPDALYGVGLVLVMWWLLRLLVPPTAAAAALALTTLTPEFTRQMTSGLADIPLAAYVTICVLGAYLWILDEHARWSSLSGFAAGAASWTKIEGAFTCLVVLAGVLIIRRAFRTPGAAAWIIWFAIFVVPWQLFQRLHSIPPNRSHFKSLHLDLLWIVRHVLSTLLETSHWGLFWPLCLTLICITAGIWWRTPVRFLAAVTLPMLALTLLAYVTHYRGNQPGSVAATAHRLYIHLAPSVAVLAVLCTYTALEEVSRHKQSPFGAGKGVGQEASDQVTAAPG